jgi:hypothetical protein
MGDVSARRYLRDACHEGRAVAISAASVPNGVDDSSRRRTRPSCWCTAYREPRDFPVMNVRSVAEAFRMLAAYDYGLLPTASRGQPSGWAP